MNINYNKEELDILESIENGEWKSIKNIQSEKQKYQEYADNTIRKNKRVNIRISERDLNEIKKKAVEEGIPYQTLISSLLHKYINGALIDINLLQNLRKRDSDS